MQWIGFAIFALFIALFKDFNFGALFSFIFWAVVIVGAITLLLSILETSKNKAKLKKEREIAKKERGIQISEISKITLEHIKILYRKRQQGIIEDDYGTKNDKKWREHVAYFVNTVLGELTGTNIRVTGNDIFEIIDNHVSNYQEEDNGLPQYTDNLTPIQFEEFCADVLNKKGWTAHATQQSGDQGVDVIAKKNGRKVAIQCKQYSTPVGNKAVQEISAGKLFIDATDAVVVTNSTYTRSAKELANSLGVYLTHYSDLHCLDDILATNPI